MLKNYRPPEDANSPKDRVKISRILIDGGEGDVSIARGQWDTEETLLIRWNGTSDQPNGFPIRFGNMTWMVVPEWMHGGVLDALRERIQDDIKKGNPDTPGDS